MASMILFDLNTGRIKEFYPNGGFSRPDYEGRPDVIFDADYFDLQTVPQKYWIQKGGSILEMTQTEKDAYDAEQTAIQAALDKPKNDLITAVQSLQSDVLIPTKVKDFADKLIGYLGIK